jgi:hypothetical protein
MKGWNHSMEYDKFKNKGIADLINDLKRHGIETLSEELKKHNINDLPIDFRIDVFFQKLKGYFDIANRNVIPFLRGLKHHNKKDEAIHYTFHCMYLWVGTLTCLNSELHFQAFASGLRSLLELYFDMHLLHKDTIPNGVEKFHRYPEVERYRSIKKCKELCKSKGISFEENFVERNKYLNRISETHIDEIKIKLWGKDGKGKPINPSHWTGLSVPDRAAKLGNNYLKLYLQFSDYCSWYIHSGPAGYAGVRKETFNDFAGFSIMNVADMFSEAIKICIHNYSRLDTCGLVSEIERIEFLAGYRLVIEEIKYIKK